MVGLFRRNTILFYQNHRCYLCGGTMARRKRKNDRKLWRTLDHITPLCAGGKRGIGNVALAHSGCNGKKGSRWPRPCEILVGQALALRMSQWVEL